jgi:Ser/Thr protein kinase RdoA (MazF antagonist)
LYYFNDLVLDQIQTQQFSNKGFQMRIVRSTIAATEIQQKIRDNYRGYLLDSVCMFEYRGLNDIYRCINGKETFFFKIYARTDITKDAIEAELEIVNYLWQSGLSTAYPIAMMNEQYLLPIETPEGTKFGVLFSEAEGVSCRNDMLDQQETIETSRLVSEMHMLLDTFPMSPKRWKLDVQLFLDRSIEILENYSTFNRSFDLLFFKDVVKQLKVYIQANCGSWNWGLCHGDFHSGNIHRSDDGNLTIFDFDFCGYGWRAYDVSPFLGNFSAGVHEDIIDKRKRRLEYFLLEYKNAGGLSDVEIDAVYKVFVPFRRIFNLGYLYEALYYVWGNKLRDAQITHDTKLLHEWIDYYW